MNRDVHLEIEGGLLERLIGRALEEGAEFAEVRRISHRKIVVFAGEGSARILLELCERYRLNCSVVSRGGRSALRDLFRKRWTLALGCLFCLLLCASFLSRLWRIDVVFTGPAAALGKREIILGCIEACGLHPGMALSQMDTGLLEKQLLARCGEYSFIGVRRQGVRLLVEAAPELPSPALYDRDYARDLVAGRDGVVVSVNLRSGTACVKPGDTVRAGQTLIRGEEEKSGEETVPVSALGEVVARCWFEGRAEGSLAESVELPTGRIREECRLKLLGFSFPLTQCEGFASETIRTEILPVGGLYLPLEIERSIHAETRTEMRSRDAADLERRLCALARAEALAQLSRAGLNPLESETWTECSREGNALRIYAVVELQADIAVSRDYFD